MSAARRLLRKTERDFEVMAKAAQDYLRQRGKKAIDKGALDRWRGLSISERVDLAYLESQGFDPDEARALAMAGTSGVRKSFSKAYVQAGKDMLPDWQHSQLHVRARASAGGKAAGQSRKLRQKPNAEDIATHKAWLERELQDLNDNISKGGPTLSEVHVDAPMTPRKKPNVRKRHVIPTNKQAHVMGMDPPAQAKYLDAQRLIRGMDHEMLTGAASPAVARTRASLGLAVSMGAYDRAFPNPDLDKLGGMDLDLACGSARECGYLGIDIYPFDYGTTVHDLALGIPFETASARSVRLCNALESLTDYTANPAPLVREIERVLALGGRLYFEGPQPLSGLVNMSQVAPSLVLLPDDSKPTAVGNQREVYARAPRRVPAIFGADAMALGTAEELPVDLLMARLAAAETPSSDMLMANLVAPPEQLRKSAVHVEQRCRVIKRDTYKQVIMGCVLIPDVEDSQGDVMTAEDIEETAHDFMVHARVVGAEHGGAQDGSNVVESYIAPADLDFDGGPYGPQTVPKGSWVLGVHVANDDAWSQVIDGTFTGFSVGGWGDRVAL